MSFCPAEDWRNEDRDRKYYALKPHCFDVGYEKDHHVCQEKCQWTFDCEKAYADRLSGNKSGRFLI